MRPPWRDLWPPLVIGALILVVFGIVMAAMDEDDIPSRVSTNEIRRICREEIAKHEAK